MLMAAKVVYWELGISLSLKTTQITVEHTVVQHIMG